ncbi:class I SAM-dependent methyltransferase [Natronolimnobius sp. AArcel1]|uniref:class I SAM-dependent methyltransferase n=1 Tax=Natronolimnobius sp. AArcel1 TaxID=1679093 RepID=UPI0013ECC9EA|nr:class I SAM-dependent methyltransferase [Natronolimnobius sp. AArcel1]NGM71077.1 class I SAM-dependent methyltransferase [Natronolimnobius sp. AArcel1]
MTDTDPFGRAIRDHYLGERDEPLYDRDGDDVREHRIEEWYFGEHTDNAWRDQWLEGPLLEMGAGVGRDALYYQDQFKTVAIEVSEHLVETMDDRGVRDARLADMFALREYFEHDRFRSAHAIGTQVGLAGSMAGVREFLADLASVTTPDATAVLDNYAPELEATAEAFGYREDSAPGFAYRVYHLAYKGDVSRTLLFRLFSIDRLREATIGTPWEVCEHRYSDVQWRAVLEKE